MNESYQVRTPDHWSDEHIAEFWNWASQHQGVKAKYFTSIFGEALISIFPKWVCRDGVVLDYGCGRGDFTVRLLKNERYKVAVADTSSDSIKEVTNRCSDYSNYSGGTLLGELPCDLPDNSFDAITFFETIEHLREKSIPLILSEHFRLLKPGGRLILTTPNDEDLAVGRVFCPFCSSEFHRMQHFTRFNIEKMSSLLEDAGLRVIRCEGVDLHRYSGLRSRILSWLRYEGRNLIGSKLKKPNLVAIAEKP
jgi:ubiquinone/menaquinone biosynthesis C-methylase UbiE